MKQVNYKNKLNICVNSMSQTYEFNRKKFMKVISFN